MTCALYLFILTHKCIPKCHIILITIQSSCFQHTIIVGKEMAESKEESAYRLYIATNGLSSEPLEFCLSSTVKIIARIDHKVTILSLL